MQRATRMTLGELMMVFTIATSCAMIKPACGGIIYNGGFEDFSTLPNWSVNLPVSGTFQHVTTWTSLADPTKTILPKEGQFFIMIKSVESGSNNTILYQDVTLLQGETISGWMAIDAYLQSLQYADNDYAEVRVLKDSTALFSQSVTVQQLNADRSLLNWQPWSWTAPADGTYRLELRAMDDPSSIGLMTWWGLFDGVSVTASVVPEPHSGIALLSGAFGAFFMRRLRRRWRKS